MMHPSPGESPVCIKRLPMNKSGAIIIEGHVQGLSNVRSLGEAGIPVYVVDTSRCIASHSKYCQKFFRCPDFASDEFAAFLVDLAQKEDIRNWLLIPSNDHAVMTLSKHKAKLEDYYKVLTPEWDIIRNIYDKSRLLKIALTAGVPVPEIVYHEDDGITISSDLSYPVLTKGRFGLLFYKATGRKAFLSHNEDELRHHLKTIQESIRLSEAFTQELIPSDNTNKTISYTAFCVNGEVKTHWAGVKLREHPIRFGTATFTKSIRADECNKQSVPLLKALNYTGVCEVEYLQDPRTGEFKLIEINARTWLWVGLAKECGVDYARLMYEFAQGKEPEYPQDYDTDKYWCNPVTDMVFGVLGSIKGEYSFRELLQTSLHSDDNALFQKKDYKPGLIYITRLLSMYRQR